MSIEKYLTEKTHEVEINLNIGFETLRKQKDALLEIIKDIDDVPKLELLEGVINIINGIQEESAEQLGELIVYGEQSLFDKENEYPIEDFEL